MPQARKIKAGATNCSLRLSPCTRLTSADGVCYRLMCVVQVRPTLARSWRLRSSPYPLEHSQARTAGGDGWGGKSESPSGAAAAAGRDHTLPVMKPGWLGPPSWRLAGSQLLTQRVPCSACCSSAAWRGVQVLCGSAPVPALLQFAVVMLHFSDLTAVAMSTLRIGCTLRPHSTG